MATTPCNHDWRRLQETLLDLHGAPSLAELPGRLLAGLRRVVAYDAASVQDDRGGMRRLPWRWADEAWRPAEDPEVGVRVMSRWSHDFFALREAFFAVSAEKHPHTDYFRRTGDGAARRLSEIVTLRELRRTAFFNEISRRNGLRRQLTLYAPLPGGGTLTLAACRTGADFTGADRARLETLRPHVALAWTRALERQRQERALRDAALRAAPAADHDPITAARTLRGRLGLTPRESETLFWVAQGKTNAEIGLILDLAAGTVKNHVERFLVRLNCPTRTAAARTALEALR